MIINGDGGYGLLAAYIGGPAAQASWLGAKIGSHLAPFLYSSHEQSELSQWLCDDDGTINIVVVIIIIIIIIIVITLCVLLRVLQLWRNVNAVNLRRLICSFYNQFVY